MTSDVRKQWKIDLSGREVYDVKREGNKDENDDLKMEGKV